jgi:biotin carboxyl carrier protein
MKMEIPVTTPVSGTIREILVNEGDVVQEGQTVAIVE